MDYLHDDRRIGRVYAAVQKGPPLTVKEYEAGNEDGPHCIVIEFEDLLNEGAKSLGFPAKEDSILRIALQFPGARRLCSQLISGLAESGDRVANRIQFMMRQAAESLTEEDGSDPAG
ncbi:MAG: hypothetical protein PHS86_15895 [Syntrophaceae bacterium]|nr:hypothetical protein [Syntrophaceae bacterium]